MRLATLSALLIALAWLQPARAAPPRVVADIAPVHAMVAQVMEGAGTPRLLMQPGASPHDFALRPSEARALQDADLVVWVGPSLTPGLGDSLETLAGAAERLTLLDLPNLRLLPPRADATFGHDHAHGEHGHDAHAHEDAHDHGDAHAHEDDHAHQNGHDHGDIDPHAWLDPEIGAVWLDAIAERLSRLDPENADLYAANARTGRADLARLAAGIDDDLAPVRDTPFVVFHDSYQYFERRFDVTAVGAISLSDARDPGPARLAALRDEIAALEVDCIFAEPQFDPGLVAAVARASDNEIPVLDPLGAGLEPGADLYPAVLRRIADTLRSCLAATDG